MLYNGHPALREEYLPRIRELYEEQQFNAPAAVQENAPDYEVGDHVVVDLPTQTIDGTVGYVGDTDVRIDPDDGYSWEHEVINKQQFEDGLRQDEPETEAPAPYRIRYNNAITVHYSPYTSEWRISGKSATGYGDIMATETYGTRSINAYKILEDTLNLRDSRVYDTIEEDGKEKRILNQHETTLAQQKQQAIKDAFASWVWKDPQHRLQGTAGVSGYKAGTSFGADESQRKVRCPGVQSRRM